MLKTLRAVLIAALAIVAITSMAAAHPRHGAHQPRRFRHHYHHHHHIRYVAQSHAFAAEGYVLSRRSRGRDIYQAALRYEGRGNPTGFRGPWCAAFINKLLRETGHSAMRSLRAIDALFLGPHVRTPELGDLAVMRHHVTIFAGWGGRGFYGLGGNQHHMVRRSSFSTRRVVAWIRP